MDRNVQRPASGFAVIAAMLFLVLGIGLPIYFLCFEAWGAWQAQLVGYLLMLWAGVFGAAGTTLLFFPGLFPGQTSRWLGVFGLLWLSLLAFFLYKVRRVGCKG